MNLNLCNTMSAASQVDQWVKNLPANQEMQETWVQSLGQEDPLEEGMATHSSILAWRVPWTMAGYSPQGCKESDLTKVAWHAYNTISDTLQVFHDFYLFSLFMLLFLPTSLLSTSKKQNKTKQNILSAVSGIKTSIKNIPSV